MARRHAPGARPNEGIETFAIGRDASDGNTDLLFWGSNEETDLELQLAVDLGPICEFCASPNPGTLMLSICPPRAD